MIDQTDLNDAVQTAKELLIAGSTADDAAARAAKEWDVPVKAVIARFEATFRMPMQEMEGVQIEKRDPLAEALEAAANGFQYPERVKAQKTFGAVVVSEGVRYRFVAWDGRKYWLVKEETKQLWWSTHVRSLNAQLAALTKMAA